MFFAVRQNRENEVVYREVDFMPTRIQQVFRRGFIDFMRAIVKRANYEILHGKKTGRLYRRRLPSGRMKNHRASAPGETHANFSGALRRSLSWKVHGWQRAEVGYGVAVEQAKAAPFYAPFVEFGTARMASRPSIKNAIDKEEPEPHFNRAFDREFA